MTIIIPTDTQATPAATVTDIDRGVGIGVVKEIVVTTVITETIATTETTADIVTITTVVTNTIYTIHTTDTVDGIKIGLIIYNVVHHLAVHTTSRSTFRLRRDPPT